MKLADAIEGYLLFKQTRVTQRTIETDQYNLAAFCQWLKDHHVEDVSDVSSDDIHRYLIYLEEERNVTRHTSKRHHCSISAFFSWLSSPEIDLVETNPVKAVNAPKLPKLKPKALTQEQVKKLISACSKGRNPRRDKALLLFMLDSGARASEVAGVRVDEVDFTSGKVKVLGKGNKERYVYLGRRALSVLWFYLQEERPEPARVNEQYFFLTTDGYQIGRNTIRLLFDRLSERVGFKAHAHMLRHTAAIEHLRHGMNLISVQHLLGHEDIKTTRRYLDALNDDDVEKQARQTSPADNWRL